MKNNATILGLLGTFFLGASAKTERPSNMFKLDEDAMIIRTPEHLEDLPVLGSVQNDEHKQSMFKMDSI